MSSEVPLPVTQPEQSSSAFYNISFNSIPRLTKALALLIIILHAIKYLNEEAYLSLALIPGRIFFPPYHVWTLVTSGFYENSLFTALWSSFGILLFGKYLEPLWGSREYLKFIFLLNFAISVSTFFTIIILYSPLQDETLLYQRYWCGFEGVLSGFLVAVKQLVPDRELFSFLAVRHLPSILFMTVVGVMCYGKVFSSAPFILFGIYLSWAYLRFYQPREGTWGDSSDGFAFVTFFPSLLQPLVAPFANLTFWFCKLIGLVRLPPQIVSVSAETTIVPITNDSADAERRRAKAALEVDRRLAQAAARTDGPVTV